MSVTQKDGTPVDEATFQPGETKIELNPAGMRMYKVNVEGKVLSVPENTTEVRKDALSMQEETVPEFFGGSFSSTPQQTSASSVSKPSGVVESPIDDANIFVGGFNEVKATLVCLMILIRIILYHSLLICFQQREQGRNH